MLTDKMWSDSAVFFSALATGAALKYMAMAWLRQRKIENYEDSGTIQSIITYPVKSCQGIYLQEAQCDPNGICYQGIYDRSFVFVDSTGLYVTQRQQPKMTFIKPQYDGDYLCLDAPNMPQLRVPKHTPLTKDNTAYCKLKMFVLKSVDCGDEAADWICRYLGVEKMRLLQFPRENAGRDLMEHYKAWQHHAVPGDKTYFSDFCSYMITSQNTLDQINPNLPEPVKMIRFRPNFVVAGSPPFTEQNWEEFAISSVTFRALDMCTRCVFINVDPDKGEKNKDSQPLKTMEKLYASAAFNNRAIFGVNSTCDDAGIVKIGDTIRVMKRREFDTS